MSLVSDSAWKFFSEAKYVPDFSFEAYEDEPMLGFELDVSDASLPLLALHKSTCRACSKNALELLLQS